MNFQDSKERLTERPESLLEGLYANVDIASQPKWNGSYSYRPIKKGQKSEMSYFKEMACLQNIKIDNT